MRTQIFSSGGGVQSSTIAALICQGELEKPDLAAIVDTEREKSSTWEYMDAVVWPALRNVGVDLVRIPKSDYTNVDVWSKTGILIPAFNDTGGKTPTYCSDKWKVRVIRRWAVEQGVRLADMWIGLTVDELRRVKQPVGKWQNRYPLIEKRLSRVDCLGIVERMGWPRPPRSSCWMCPNMTTREWRELKGTPDFEKAVRFEREIRLEDDELLLSREGVTLDKASFDDGQGDLFTGLCDSGMCFV